MGRLVKPKIVSSAGRATSAGRDEGESYAERVAKYIPAEVVAVYMSLTGILKAVENDDSLKLGAAWFVFALGLIATPLYLTRMRRPQSGEGWQLVLATVSFALWAYTLGGPFETLSFYRPWLGSLAVGIWTFLAGRHDPKVAGESRVAPAVA
jgi:hypothetical protein